jgi:hypothetical protein
MDDKAGAAGLAALAICESLLLALTESKVLAVGEARSILEDAAAANRNAIPLTPDNERHEAAATVIELILPVATRSGSSEHEADDNFVAAHAEGVAIMRPD